MQSRPSEPSGELEWGRVVRVQALGTDTFGPFEIWINLTMDDGVWYAFYPFTPGYQELLDELPRRFPDLEPDWKEAMEETPWHVERLIYCR